MTYGIQFQSISQQLITTQILLTGTKDTLMHGKRNYSSRNLLRLFDIIDYFATFEGRPLDALNAGSLVKEP